MDRHEPVSRNIKKIIDDISQNLHFRTECLRKDIIALKKRLSDQNRDFSMQYSALMNVFEEANRESQSLTNRKALLKKSLEKEEADLERLEVENQVLQNQLKDLENTNTNFIEKQKELEEKARLLKVKLQQLKERTHSRESEHRGLNEFYKKYLGLEIQKIRENMVKIAYKNLGSECHVLLDFSKDESVVETLPELNLERLNYLFKEKGSFYEFVKSVRDQIKQKL